MQAAKIAKEVIVFWADVSGNDLSRMTPETRLLEDLKIDPDDLEAEMEEFEIRFEIVGRIGKGEIAERQATRKKNIFWQIVEAAFGRRRSDVKSVIFDDMPLAELIEIATKKQWPESMIQKAG